MSQKSANLIYCIIEKEDVFSTTQIADNLERIWYEDIAAVVSELEAKNIDELSEEQMQQWLSSYQKTNIDVFQSRNIVPLRFGTIVDEKEEIENFLAVNYLHIKSSLNKVRNKAEFSVMLSWDLQPALQDIIKPDLLEELQRNASPLESGRKIAQIAEKKKRELENTVHRKLSSVSIDSSESKLTDDSMIMKRSYLIEKTAEKVFDSAMEELGKENKSYLHFKYVGPIPAYSFVPIEFSKGNFELIDWARKKLLLPEKTTFREIKSSYRNLSLKYHPDKTDEISAEEKFKQIAEAYRILETYCRSNGRDKLSQENMEYSFTKDSVEKFFIVKNKN